MVVELCRIHTLQEINARCHEVKKEVKERFYSIGVEIQDMYIKEDRLGKFDRSLVKITPVNLRRIWGRRLGLQNCAVVEHKV